MSPTRPEPEPEPERDAMPDGLRSSPGDRLLATLRRGSELSRELMDENARLQRALRELRPPGEEAVGSEDQAEKRRRELLERIEELESRNEGLLEQLQRVEQENLSFAERLAESQQSDNNLANLYVASYRLHTTLDPDEVVEIVLEIVIDLIGAEVCAVYLPEEGCDVLEPVAARGEGVRAFPSVRLGEGLVGGSVARGVIEVGDPARSLGGPERGVEPLVSIPLRVEEQVVGAIVIYTLMRQKDCFSVLDQELFTLLAGHAATAVLSSRLYAQSQRKLHTIQGFIDLLTKK